MNRSRLSSNLPSPRRGFQREALGDQSNSFDKLAEALAPGERAKRPFASLLLMPALLALWLAGGSAVQAGPNPATTPVLYMVATAHLDDQWNWTIQDTINTYIPATLHTNFAFFQSGQYPDYVFNWEESWRYQLVQEYYPADYVTLTNYIAQGRWRVSGAGVVAGDVNSPSPEALIRHVLLAENYYAQTFSKTSLDIFLPDCFGFGYALPSVGAHCGLKGFSSQKLSWGCWTNIPFVNIGRWIGVDGSSLIGVLQPGGYNSTVSVNLATDSAELTRMTNNFAQTGLYLDYRYYGTGDQGGGPTPASVNWVEQSVQTSTGPTTVLSAGSDQMYRDLTPTQVAMLPAYQGELVMQTHGTGTYTSHAEMKKYNRQNEQLGDAAERISVIADWLQGGGTYPQEKLNKAWTRFLWNQFHDLLTGTSIPAAYTFSWNDELLSLNEFGSEETHGVGVLAKALDTTAAGVPLVVYNPLSLAREDIVEAMVNFTNGAPSAVRVFDGAGNEVPSQMGTPSGTSVPVTFLADVPAVGAAVYDVRPAASPSSLSTGLSVSSTQLENARYRVQLNANGDVSSILDKVNNQQLLSAPIRWDFLYDQSTSWPAWEVQYNNEIAAPTSYLGGPASVQVLENGPTRVSLVVTRANAGSTFTERIRLAAGAGGDRVEWDVSANWASLQTLCKMEFPLAVSNANATFDLGMGTIQRPNETANLYEVPAQQWADLTSSNGNYGVTIMNDCRYGWDKPSNNTLRQTIFHSPAVGSSYTYQATNSFGTHRLTLAVMGHTNDWRSGNSSWVAARLNQPLQAFQTLPHAGGLGKAFSFLSCNNSNVMVKAVKRAENSNEIIVRLQELTGQAQSAQLSCATAITAARQVTGAETPLTTLSPAGGTLTVSLGGYAPMTLALTLAVPASTVAKPASTAVSLPFNLDAISTDGNRINGNFDGGYTFPAELMPATIVRDGISFQLGPTNDNALNALSCQGQTISFSGSGYDHLYFLAASASNIITGTFTVNGHATTVSVPYFTGFIGQWNPPYVVTNQEVAWVCTHRHDSGGANNAYNFCYLFKYRIDLPPNATSLVLPNAPNLRLFAMTLTTNTTPETTVAGGTLGQNLLPWANAGPNQTVNAPSASAPVSLTLDGSGSADPDGSIVSYVWSQNGASVASGIKPTVTLPIGTNLLLLTVTDNAGGTSQAAVTVTVLPPLTVVLTASPTNSASAPLTVQFGAQASGGVQTPLDTTDDHQGTITAQGSNPPNEAATNAFDNNLASKWLDFATNYPSTRQSWIQYQYANGLQYLVTNYTITSGNDAASYPARNPANWHLLGSNNNGTNWTTLDIRTNQVFTASQQTLAWSVTSPGLYNLYRLQIDSVYNPPAANSMQLDEIQLIGPPVFSYWWSFGDGTTGTGPNPQHTYSSAGDYLVILGVSCGIYTGTNTAVITIGTPLTATTGAAPAGGVTPLTVQLTGLAAGGNGTRTPYDTTDDQRGNITAQGSNPPNEISVNAFDNNTATKWLDFANVFPTTRSSWIQYQYANGLQCLVSQYALTTANDHPDRDPLDWRLLGSNDGGSTWATLDIQTNGLSANRFYRTVFNVASPAAYNLYRLQIDSVANVSQANSVQLSENELIGNPAYTYFWSFGDTSTSTSRNPQHTYTSPGTYTASLVVGDGVATASNSVTVTVMPTPVLACTGPSAGNLTLSWPAYATNCHLYAATNLSPPVAWSVVTNSVISAGGSVSVTLPCAPGNRFFQLKSP
jgi:alpha-mannosidase